MATVHVNAPGGAQVPDFESPADDRHALVWAGGGWSKGAVMLVGDAPTAHTHELADVTGLLAALDSKAGQAYVDAGLMAAEQIANRGAPGGYAPLDALGLVPNSVLPPLAITDTYAAADQAAMDALVPTVQRGDVVIRADTSESFIWDGAAFQELLTPPAPVQSVNGQIGVVALAAADVGAPTQAALDAHLAATGEVHGIADTSRLITMDNIGQYAPPPDLSAYATRAYVDASANTVGAASVTLAPGTAARNVVQPTADVVPFALRAAAGNTSALQQWQDSTGAAMASLTQYGGLTSNHDVGARATSAARVLVGYGTGGAAALQLYYDTEIRRGGVGSVIVSGIGTATSTTMVVRGVTGQGANLQQWQDATSATLAHIDAVGTFRSTATGHTLGSVTAVQGSTMLTVRPSTATQVGLALRGVASQTADLLQGEDSTGAVVSKVSADGFVHGQGARFGSPIPTYSGTQVGITAQAGASALALTSNGTQNIQEWRSAGGTVITAVAAAGNMIYNPGVNGDVMFASGGSATTNAALRVLRYPSFADQVDSAFFQFGGGTAGNNAMVSGMNGLRLARFAINAGNVIISDTAGHSTVPAPQAAALFSVVASNATDVAIVSKGAASQTANFQEWQDSTGAAKASVDSFGALSALSVKVFSVRSSNNVTRMVVNNGGSAVGVQMTADAATTTPLAVQGVASQAADLTQWLSATPTVVARVGGDGAITAMNTAASQTTLGVVSARPALIFGPSNGTSLWQTIGGQLLIQGNGTAGRSALAIGQLAAQTADPFQVQDSTNAVLAAVSSNGSLYSRGRLSIGQSVPNTSYTASIIGINTTTPVLMVRGALNTATDLVQIQDASPATLFAFTAQGRPRWVSPALTQTTVGAAGAGAALPATPTKYLQVVDDTGATLVVPAYAAA